MDFSNYNRACPNCGMKMPRWKFLTAAPGRVSHTDCQGCGESLAYQSTFVAWVFFFFGFLTVQMLNSYFDVLNLQIHFALLAAILLISYLLILTLPKVALAEKENPL